MSKRSFTFFLFIGFILSVASAQQKYIQQALKYVDKGKFEKAVIAIDKVDLSKSEAYLGDYYLAKGLISDGEGDLDTAVMFYEKAMETKNLNELPNKVIVDYAGYMFNSGDYDGAIAFINNANENMADTKYPIVLDRIRERAFWAKENINNYSSSLGHDSIIDVALGSNKLIIDVPRFGAAFYKDSLVFASYTEYKKPTVVQEEASEYNRILQDYKRTNTDLYIASLDDEFDKRKLFAEDISTLENEGAITFNADYTQMYYTRNVYKKGRESYMIYYARKVGNDWIDEGPLNFNSENFNTMQPSLAPDGKGLYFVSNNPGGYGGYDIYYAEGSGKNFAKPKNLGPTINTKENEIFPYMQNDTVMIYSSNGLLGFGGYDIFWVDIKNDTKIPTNLLQPINSSSDDYCIVGNRDNPEQMLFFSDRDLSMGNLAMYINRDKNAGESLSFKISLLPPGKKITPEELALLSDGNSLLKSKVDEYNALYGGTTSVADNTTNGSSNASSGSDSGTAGSGSANGNMGSGSSQGNNGANQSGTDSSTGADGGTGSSNKGNNGMGSNGAGTDYGTTNAGSETGFGSLYFGLNSSTLSDEAKKNLTMVAEYLNAKKAMKLVITGNAGLRGNESYNLVISAYRAYQAYEFMTNSLALPGSSILLEANGKYFPNVKTWDVEKGLENRRVDLKAQWEEPNTGLKVRFKLTGKYQEQLVTNLFDIYMEQHPEVDYLYRTEKGKGIYRVALNHNTSVNELIRINQFGSRNYLMENEIVFVKEHSTPLNEMVFEVNVKTLYYVTTETSAERIAEKFDVDVSELRRVNKLVDGQLVEARSKLIIPIKK